MGGGLFSFDLINPATGNSVGEYVPGTVTGTALADERVLR
jgi:hypothetical protein